MVCSHRRLIELLHQYGFSQAGTIVSDGIAAPIGGTICVVALPYYAEKERQPAIPVGEIAPFARYNYYKEVTARLKQVRRICLGGSDYTKKNSRIFCNSPLPEKRYAFAAGVGWIGRHSLIITPPAGSLVVLGGLTLPFSLKGDPCASPLVSPRKIKDKLEANCGKCRGCLEACPVGAILPEGRINTERCLQALSTLPGPLPQFALENWKDMIYGCQICQEVCPYNRDLPPGKPVSRGALGSFISLEFLLRQGKSEEGIRELKTFLKPTVLGQNWIPKTAIVRNAAAAAAHTGARTLLPHLRQLAGSSPDTGIRSAAAWAAGQLSGRQPAEKESTGD